MASLRAATAPRALEMEHDSAMDSLAGRPRSDRTCISPTATFVVAVAALILAIIGLALGITFMSPRSDVLVTRSPVSPPGFKKIGEPVSEFSVRSRAAGKSGTLEPRAAPDTIWCTPQRYP